MIVSVASQVCRKGHRKNLEIENFEKKIICPIHTRKALVITRMGLQNDALLLSCVLSRIDSMELRVR